MGELGPQTVGWLGPQARCENFVAERCRSCDQLALPRDERIPSSLLALRQLLQEHHFAAATIEACETLDNPVASRSKAKLSVGGTLDAPIIGLTDGARQSIELLDCPLHMPLLNQIAAWIKNNIAAFRLFPYDIGSQRGELKYLILRCSPDAQQAIVRFVLRSTEAVPRIRKMLPLLCDAFPVVVVVSVNIQPKPAAVLEGNEEIVLTDSAVIWERYNDIELAFGPQSFAQVTPSIATKLYARVARAAAEWGSRRAVDLYCGVGGFSLALAPQLEWVKGVELSENAIACAKQAALRNGLANAEFFCSDVAEYLSGYAGDAPDLVIVNPPRRGLSGEIIEVIQTWRPENIAYSSCNSITLMRDLAMLRATYELVVVVPFDMFPGTSHLEVLALLQRRTS